MSPFGNDTLDSPLLTCLAPGSGVTYLYHYLVAFLFLLSSAILILLLFYS